MKKVFALVILVAMVFSLSSAVAQRNHWTVSFDDYAITVYQSGGAVYDYDGMLLCAWHIDDPATYVSMDYIGSGWLDAADEPLVAINAPGTLAAMYYYQMTDAPANAWYVPQNVMDAIGYQPAF